MTRSREVTHTIVLAAVALVLMVTYLGLRGRDRVQYRLPELQSIDSESVDQIRIRRPSGETVLAGESEGWVLLPEGFPASPSSVQSMLDIISSAELSELVSITGSLSRYDLEEDEAVHVQAYDDSKVVRSLILGKQAATFRHTYVKLPDDSRVFQMPGDLRAIFDRGVSELRNKRVLSFNQDDIRRIEAELPDTRIVLRRTTESTDSDRAESGEVWTSEDGAVWDTQAVNDLLRRASALNASRFGEGNRQEVAADIVFHGDRPHRLTIYAKDDRVYPAGTSESDYPFFLTTWQAEAILNAFEIDRTAE